MNNIVLNKWHDFVNNPQDHLLDEILDEDVVFYSPVVWTPQKGKMITKLYLLAAAQVFSKSESGFKYLYEVVSGSHMVLEFEVELEGITINGVDILELNKAGKIQSFKVMVRPLKAVQKLHEKMMEMLAN
jgi:hypothetical protein